MSEPEPVASTNEVTPLDFWRWRIYYEDGTMLDELDAAGVEHGWSEVARERVRMIEMAPRANGYPSVLCELPPGAAAIFERRRAIPIIFATLDAIDGGTLTVLGWDHPDGACHRVYLRHDGLVATSYRHLA